MAAPQRVRATLFDKLVSGLAMEGLIEEGERGTSGLASMRTYAVPAVERFNEEALRATVRRELAWLLNTTHLGAACDLAPYPQVETSVLNYGVPDLTGRPLTRRLLLQRARELRAAIRAFEPRIDEASLVVEPVEALDEMEPVTFLIHADVISAVHALPVKFRTEIEADTAAVTVRD